MALAIPQFAADDTDTIAFRAVGAVPDGVAVEFTVPLVCQLKMIRVHPFPFVYDSGQGGR